MLLTEEWLSFIGESSLDFFENNPCFNLCILLVSFINEESNF